MSNAIRNLVRLFDLLAEFEGVSHWAISMRITKKGDFLSRLRKGGDCSTRTYERVMFALSANWPADLDWPSDIPRPDPRAEVA